MAEINFSFGGGLGSDITATDITHYGAHYGDRIRIPQFDIAAGAAARLKLGPKTAPRPLKFHRPRHG
jgi:hypothetical protein